METFLFCFAELVLYSFGVLVACGLVIEICYRSCFLLMGKRAGRAFWFATSCLGTPIHELGHAIMCLLFGHRIEKIRLFPNREGVALVDHSYKKGNLYATFGNLWIGLGPLFSGLGVIFLVLFLVFPESMHSYEDAVNALLSAGAPVGEVWQCLVSFLRGLLTEETRAIWIRLLAAVVLFSLALHVRLSAADIRGMLPGLPIYLVLAAFSALIITLLGGELVDKMTVFLQRTAWTIVSLFSLILLFALLQLVLVIVYRLLYGLIVLIHGGDFKKSEPLPDEAFHDYRDRDWEEFKK